MVFHFSYGVNAGLDKTARYYPAIGTMTPEYAHFVGNFHYLKWAIGG
jgi:hypothetical protein